MTPEELGMSDEAVAYVEALCEGRRDWRTGLVSWRPGTVEIALARFRVADGVADDEDRKLVLEHGL